MRVAEVVGTAAIGTPDRANRKIIVVVVGVDVTGNGNLVKVALARRQLGLPLAAASAGKRSAANIAMMAITTSNSIRVKPHALARLG